MMVSVLWFGFTSLLSDKLYKPANDEVPFLRWAFLFSLAFGISLFSGTLGHYLGVNGLGVSFGMFVLYLGIVLLSSVLIVRRSFAFVTYTSWFSSQYFNYKVPTGSIKRFITIP